MHLCHPGNVFCRFGCFMTFVIFPGEAVCYLYPVKKLAAILLVSLYIFGSTDAYQFLKLPQFIQHYLLHRQQNNELSLSSFLQIHYNNGPVVIDDDFDKDMQLPFKTAESVFSRTVNIIVPVTNCSVQFEPVFSCPDFFTGDEIVPDFFSGKPVFQPPRFC